MQSPRLVVLAALLALAPAARARLHAGDPETAVAMAAVEGDACPPDEHKRFQTIVCKVEETCGCADTLCKLDWCADYVHQWRMDFQACVLKGCAPGV